MFLYICPTGTSSDFIPKLLHVTLSRCFASPDRSFFLVEPHLAHYGDRNNVFGEEQTVSGAHHRGGLTEKYLADEEGGGRARPDVDPQNSSPNGGSKHGGSMDGRPAESGRHRLRFGSLN